MFLIVLFFSELLQIKVFGDGAHTVSSCQQLEYAAVCPCLTGTWFAVSLGDTVGMRYNKRQCLVTLTLGLLHHKHRIMWQYLTLRLCPVPGDR